MNGLGLEVSLASLAAAWPQLQWLALENTSSDFNGSLALPQELAGCSRLQELRLGSNYDLDWGSLQVLQQCTVRQSDMGCIRTWSKVTVQIHAVAAAAASCMWR